MPPHQCDFCSEPVQSGDTNAWVYDVEDFEKTDQSYASEGAWLACATCAAFIRQYDMGELKARDNLTRRSMEKFRIKYDLRTMPASEVNRLLMSEITKLHAAFWDFRKDTLPIPYALKKMEA